MQENSGSRLRDCVSGWVLPAAVVLVALAIVVSGQIIAHGRTDERDAWQYAYYGDLILRGKVLYADMWEHKPPGIFWLNALGVWMGQGNYGGVVALCAAAAVATLIMFYMLARRCFGGTAAGIGTLLAALYLTHPTYYGASNRPESFVLLFELAAIMFYVRALPQSSRHNLLLAGLMAGAALVFKQKGLAALAAIFAHQAYVFFTTGRRIHRILRPLCWFGLGWILAVAIAVAGVVLTADAHCAWHAIVTFNSAYLGKGLSVLPNWSRIYDHAQLLALPVILASAGLLQWILSTKANARGDSAAGADHVVVLLAWLVASTYLAFIGPRPAFYYVTLAFPALLLLATFAIQLVLDGLISREAPRDRILRCMALMWIAFMALDPIKHQLQWLSITLQRRMDDPDPFNNRRKVQTILEYTEPDDPVLVWGFDPKTYWDARRPPASRFIDMNKFGTLGGDTQFMIDDILSSLQRDPPKVLILQAQMAQQMKAGLLDGAVSYRRLGDHVCAQYRPIQENDPASYLILKGRIQP